MCKLVFLVIPVLQGDEDSQVVGSSHDTHTCAGELCAQLIIASCADALLGAIDVEGRDWGMMRCLLGKVRYSHGLAVAFSAAGSARGCRVRGLESRMGVFDFPVTLRELVSQFCPEAIPVAYPEELAQGGVVGLAWFAFDVFLRQRQSCMLPSLCT